MKNFYTDRRAFLRMMAGAFVAVHFPLRAMATVSKAIAPGPDSPRPTLGESLANEAARDNFKIIYSTPALREEFRKFLVNVYHLYPEDKFHALIRAASEKYTTDLEVYREVAAKVPEIKPLLSEITYALPALAKQKEEMGAQAAQLIGNQAVQGYVEIGTPGRYVGQLKNRVKMSGPVYLVHDHEPGFSPVDIAERGGLSRVGTYVPLDNYASWGTAQIADASVDVITNFIGIHHAPRDRLKGFTQSIHRALRPGGKFILRDHDAHSREMTAMVGLAHDVYNAGLGLKWEENEAELRYFKPLAEIERYLKSFGFAREAEPVYQAGDPSKNALMLFVKRS